MRSEDLLALLQVVGQVDLEGAQRARGGSGVEVGDLGAGLVAPGSKVVEGAGLVEGDRDVCVG